MKNRIIIETENLILRYFSMDDVQKVLDMSKEEGMLKWIPDQAYEDEQETAEVIEFLRNQYTDEPAPDKAPYVLGLELKNSGELIGHVGLSPTEDGVEIGYAVESKRQGSGYATEAVLAMSDWAIDKLGLPAVLGIVASENMGSCRVLEKVGYVLIDEKEKNAFGRQCLCRTYIMDKN